MDIKSIRDKSMVSEDRRILEKEYVKPWRRVTITTLHFQEIFPGKGLQMKVHLNHASLYSRSEKLIYLVRYFAILIKASLKK